MAGTVSATRDGLVSPDGVEHRHDILGGNAGQDVVHLLEDKAAAGRQRLDLPPHVRADLLRRAGAEDRLRVAAAAPEQMSLPKSRFSPAASMPAVEICTGFIASRPASMRSGSRARTLPHECSITRTGAATGHPRGRRGELLGRVPHEAVPRLEQRAVHLGGHLRPGLHAQVVAEDDDVDGVPDGGRGTVSGFPGASRRPCPGRPPRARAPPASSMKKLSLRYMNWPGLQQVAAEQADDGALGAARAASPRPSRAAVSRPSGRRPRSRGCRGGGGGPHALLDRRAASPGRSSGLNEGIVRLLEIQRAVGHAARARCPPADFITHWPGLPLQRHPGRHQAGAAVRQRPVLPVRVVPG